MIIRLFLTCFFLFAATSAQAATYYVATTGNNSNAGTIAAPWADPIYGAAQLGAGDTLYLRAGTYIVPGGAGNNIRPFASNVTISGYEDEDVFIDGGTAPTGTILVANGYNYITFKNMRMKGMVYMTNTTGSIVENMEIWEGGDGFTGSTDFGELIYINTTESVTIRNNRLHDNVYSAASGGNNSPIIQVYKANNLLIENNDIYNSPMFGIYLKDYPTNVIVRYNHFYNCVQGAIQATGQVTGDNVAIYQNVFRNNGSSGSNIYQTGAMILYGTLTNLKVYNNTFVNNYRDFNESVFSGNPFSVYIWNNISYLPVQYHTFMASQTTNYITYSDYNTFYNDGSWAYLRTNIKTTLADWQSASGLDANSTTSNPNFVNASGTTPADFKRTIYTTDGRGGAYASIKGAYITGEECIGYDCEGTNPPSPTCSDGIQNGDETGVDCGGSCPACETPPFGNGMRISTAGNTRTGVGSMRIGAVE